MAFEILFISIIGNYVIKKLKKLDFKKLENKFNFKHVQSETQRKLSNLAWKMPPVIISFLGIIFNFMLLFAVFNIIYDNAGIEKTVIFGFVILATKLNNINKSIRENL